MRGLRAFVLITGLTTAQTVFALTYTVGGDVPDGVYRSGAPIVFTVRRDADGPDAKIAVLRNHRETLLTETLATGETECVVRFTPPEDGWYVCTVTEPGQKKPAASIGAVVNPEDFKPGMPAPSDLDVFWSAQKARLAASPAEPVLSPLSPEQRGLELQNPDHRKKVEMVERSGVVGFNLEIPCLDVRPVRGYFVRPANARAGGQPAILYFRAAGVNGGWCRSSYVNTVSLADKYGALVVDMNAHGMLNGQPQAYYDELANNELKGYQSQGRESREEFYFLGMFLRLMRAIDFLAAQPEWDGRHLICIGISQGGAQALAAGGLDARVSAVVATVPGMCDLGGRLVGNPSGWPGIGDASLDDPRTRQSLATTSYFDMAHLNARSHAATLVTVGLVDTTCPPTGVFAAYNALRTEKRIIVIPSGGHHGLSSPDRNLRATHDAFIAAQTGKD